MWLLRSALQEGPGGILSRMPKKPSALALPSVLSPRRGALMLSVLAAKTERIVLASGIMQISARTPAMTAQTALTLAMLSGNRFILGLGVSGPQVVEGLHGQSFAHPLGRMRETMAILRQAFAGERISFAGQHITLPRPGGEGKALRLSVPPNLYVAADELIE